MTPPSPPRGVTLVELVVAMAIGGIVLALVGAISVRQQRLHTDLADRLALAEQLRQASSVLPIELRGLGALGGDLRDARDTAVEFRGTIASAVICDTLSSAVVLAPADSGVSTFASFLSAVAPGDTAWILTPGDSSDQWNAFSIASAAFTSGGGCRLSVPSLPVSAQGLSRLALRLAAPLSSPVGSVVRITRPMRYSLYRGGDGLWYLGARDWNSAAMKFNTIQPVSGPFSAAAAHGLELQYFDSTGTRLSSPVAATRDVALIRVAIRGQSRNLMRAFSSARGRATDSALVSISLRNRQ
jgi:prepilin-type N-terminal cleavage/methylation domain-containing protein